MTTTTATEPVSKTLSVPGATLTYDVRQSESTTEPPLVLIGSPMGAGGFPSLAAHFPDRTIVTFDPRNNGERSPADDPSAPITPDIQSDDAHAVIEAIGAGRSTCSPAAAARSSRWRSSRSIRTTSERSSPTAAAGVARAGSEQALAATRSIYDAYQAHDPASG